MLRPAIDDMFSYVLAPPLAELTRTHTRRDP